MGLGAAPYVQLANVSRCILLESLTVSPATEQDSNCIWTLCGPTDHLDAQLGFYVLYHCLHNLFLAFLTQLPFVAVSLSGSSYLWWSVLQRFASSLALPVVSVSL